MEINEITPEAAGFASCQLDELDAFFAKHIKNQTLQFASYLLARQGQVFASKAMGQLLPEAPEKPFQTDSIRWIASITKLFTAVAIMQLVEKGKLYIEQPVSAFFKEFSAPPFHDILIFHLLTHTSGIAPDPEYFQSTYHREPQYSTNMEEFIPDLLSGPKFIGTGKQWVYSSDGFILLGEIISRITGLSYQEYVQQNIIAPLGLKDTFFQIPEAVKARVAVVTEWDKERITEDKPFFYSAAGGIYSTLYDIFCFGQMILNKGIFKGTRIVSRKGIEAMCSNVIPANTPAFCWGRDLKAWEYGLGIDITFSNMLPKNCLDHEGAGRCALYLDPAEEFLAFYFIGIGDKWIAETMENPRSIIWAGIK